MGGFMSGFESPSKALEAVVTALGGSKCVAPQLWPDKGVDEARRLLCDCLNDERPAKLDLSQVLLILRLAKARGVHVGMEYVCTSLGYAPPVALEPRDELADLLRQVVDGQQQLAAQQGRLLALQSQLRAVA